MNFKAILFLLLTLSFWQNPLAAQLNKINLNGQSYYINGINIPWNNFGWDFGIHDDWGSGYDAEWFEDAFVEMEANGINTVRVWIHCDGRASPEFDQNGYVTGLDENLLDELEDLLTKANDHAIMVVLCLWSHDMLEDHTAIAGDFAGLHSDLIKDSEKSQSYINQALVPMVQRLRDHCNILAWEVMNEPEWGMKISQGDATAQTVSAKAMQLFIGHCIAAIRAHSDQNITVGSAIPFGNELGQYKNHWQESEFHRLGFDCNQVYLDFYSFHYYDWMSENTSPFEKNARHWSLGKPVVIAEAATVNAELPNNLSPFEQLERTAENEYAGMIFWSYNASDDLSDWANCKAEIQDFGATRTDIAYDNSCDSIYIEKPLLVCPVYPNPAREYINFPVYLTNPTHRLEVELLNAHGQIVRKVQLPIGVMKLNIQNLSTGFFYLKLSVLDEALRPIKTGTYRLVLI